MTREDEPTEPSDEVRDAKMRGRRLLAEAEEQGTYAALARVVGHMHEDQADLTAGVRREVQGVNSAIQDMRADFRSVVEGVDRAATAMELDAKNRAAMYEWVRQVTSSKWGAGLLVLILVSQGVGVAVLLFGAAHVFGIQGLQQLARTATGAP